MTFSVDQMKSLIGKKGGLAQANLWKVQLPNLGIEASYDLNLLCKDVQLPGRQILTQERIIGMKQKKVAYGYAEEDVSMTFYVMNDYGIKEYFDEWQSRIIDFQTKELKYKDDYVFDIEITQLQKKKRNGLSVNFEIDFTANNLADLFDFSITSDIEVYKCKLIRAFPTTINALQLNSEQNGLLELNIQFSYDDWIS
jgi:hypothetical protein|tara:strand:+ start:12656 stop:13246 length:591 start_codon:yes stop_codon:yes gene_type:complete